MLCAPTRAADTPFAHGKTKQNLLFFHVLVKELYIWASVSMNSGTIEQGILVCLH